MDPPSGQELEPRGPAHWLLLAAAMAAPALLAALAWRAHPDPRGYGTHEQLGLEPCGVMARYGVPCPGCGVTTATVLALRGHPLASARTQPFGLALGLGVPLLSLVAIALHLRGRDLGLVVARGRPGRWIAGVALLLALSWLYRLALA